MSNRSLLPDPFYRGRPYENSRPSNDFNPNNQRTLFPGPMNHSYAPNGFQNSSIYSQNYSNAQPTSMSMPMISSNLPNYPNSNPFPPNHGVSISVKSNQHSYVGVCRYITDFTSPTSSIFNGLFKQSTSSESSINATLKLSI